MRDMALSHCASASQRRFDLIERSLGCLTEGQLRQAYTLADMSCLDRVPAPDDLLLRGEIAARLGFPGLEQADVEAAFAIDPSSPLVQLRMLEMLWKSGRGDAADALARLLLQLDPKPVVLPAALAALRCAAGRAGFAWVQSSPAAIRIVIAAPQPGHFAIDVTFEGERRAVQVELQRQHAPQEGLSAFGSTLLAWPEGARTAQCASVQALDWIASSAAKPLYRDHPKPAALRTGWCKGPAGPLTIIMPVYADIDLTRQAIASVLASRSSLPQRLVLIDDCGPDPALRALLAEYAREPDVTLMVNPVNFGFVGSVNRALLAFPDGDAVLLNADTIVAAGWLERLAAAAYSQQGIGTATPLSNNGELTSLPAPFAGTDMPSAREVVRIDGLVQQLNPGRVVPLPNGVGFCLYLTAACRQATGLLNDADYRQGYLEEVDYCLRASGLGFSHVCACDVFVGHAGSRSFGARKRALTTHNLARLERAFPAARANTYHFMQSDPLLSLRYALQKRLLETAIPSGKAVTLVVGRDVIPADGGRDLPIVHALTREGDVLRLSFGDVRRGVPARLHRDGAMAPSHLPVALASQDPLSELLDLLRPIGVARVVYLDAHHPLWAQELPARLAVGYDLHAVDDSLLGGGAGSLVALEQEKLAELSGFLAGAGAFVAAASCLSDLARSRGLRQPKYEPFDFSPPVAVTENHDGAGGRSVAVFLDAGDGAAWRWLQELGRALMRCRSSLRLVVFGTTPDDDALRRTGAVTVTGFPAEALAPAAFALHGCIATIALIPDGAVEHPDLPVIARSPRPLLSRSRYLPEVLGCDERDGRLFTLAQPVEAMVRTLTRIQRGRDG